MNIRIFILLTLCIFLHGCSTRKPARVNSGQYPWTNALQNAAGEVVPPPDWGETHSAGEIAPPLDWGNK